MFLGNKHILVFKLRLPGPSFGTLCSSLCPVSPWSDQRNLQSRKPSMDIANIRNPYHGETSVFDDSDLFAKEPIGQFRHWFEEVCQTGKVDEPNAMSLATADRQGSPSVRTVLLKGFDEQGFKFFTNYQSRKGKDLAENPRCSLLFYWYAMKRQVTVTGTVEKLSKEESTKYFHCRPRPSQIGAAISNQSSVIASRQELDVKYTQMMKEYEDENKMIPKPECWGGYLVKPERIEFWQGQTNRVHDRYSFRRLTPGETPDPTLTHEGENGWFYERLAP